MQTEMMQTDSSKDLLWEKERPFPWSVGSWGSDVRDADGYLVCKTTEGTARFIVAVVNEHASRKVVGVGSICTACGKRYHGDTLTHLRTCEPSAM